MYYPRDCPRPLPAYLKLKVDRLCSHICICYPLHRYEIPTEILLKMKLV